jgi:Protein of unknown function (DUF3570)
MRDLRRQNRAARRRARHLRKDLRQRKGVLAVLTTSALLLPGLARAQEERWSVDYGYSLYSEDDLDSSKLSAGSAKRYDINTQMVSLRGPITGRMDFGLDVVYETMSGASPWFIEQDATTGDPVVVMTGASIEDKRTDFNGHGTYYFDTARLNLQSGYSIEDDYRAINVGFGSEHDFGEKNTTLSWGLGGSFDTIDPTPTATNANPSQEDKRTISVFGGWSQVLGKSSTLQTILSYQNGSGFLSDPYKLVSVAGVNLADHRPDSRNQFAVLARYRRHFSSVSGSLHLDYRFYIDDWNINAHTLELAWYQSLFDFISIVPSVRYYTQSQADFYSPYFVSALTPSDYASSDYRLSPFGALSGKIRVEARLSEWPFHMAWKLGASYERYQSSGSFAIQSVGVENPALVSFNAFMINLSARF